jgi:hypothetical protein
MKCCKAAMALRSVEIAVADEAGQVDEDALLLAGPRNAPSATARELGATGSLRQAPAERAHWKDFPKEAAAADARRQSHSAGQP